MGSWTGTYSAPIWLSSDDPLKGVDNNDLIRIGKDGDYRLMHKAKGHFDGNANTLGALCINIGKDDAFGIYSSSEKGPGQDALLEVKGGNGNLFVKGSLGIGTAKPEAKLQVDGDIKASEVKVSSLIIAKNSKDVKIDIGEDVDGLDGIFTYATTALKVWGDVTIEGNLKVNGHCSIKGVCDITERCKMNDCHFREIPGRDGEFFARDQINLLGAKVKALEERIWMIEHP